MVVTTADGALLHYNRVGLFAALVTALSLWLAGRVRPAQEASRSAESSAELSPLPVEISECTLDLAADGVATEISARM
jgi:hypothetical protein